MAEENKKSGLDRRQRDIKVGAGLEESRYNVEFIDFLRKWGPTVMLVIAAAALSFMGLQKWRESKEAKAGVAFGDVDAAMNSAGGRDVNPEVLVRIAEDNAGQGAVPLLARIAAADQWRASAMKGYRPGTSDARTGAVTNQDDLLTTEGKKEYLEKARQQYQMVVDQTAGNKAKATFTLTGLMGIAAIAETNGKVEEAKAAYKQAQDLAEAANYPEYVTLAKSRFETADKFAVPVTILPDAMVMSWDKPAPVAPTPAPAAGSSLLAPDLLSPNLGGSGAGVAPTITIPPLSTPAATPPATNPAPATDPAKPATPAPAPATPPATPKP